MCECAGPAAQDGLKLRSFRAETGLLAYTNLPTRFQAFPGIINGGVLSTLFDCHGNWTAAIALMDRKKLPRPPLTLTAQLQVIAHPPAFCTPLVHRSGYSMQQMETFQSCCMDVHA